MNTKLFRFIITGLLLATLTISGCAPGATSVPPESEAVQLKVDVVQVSEIEALQTEHVDLINAVLDDATLVMENSGFKTTIELAPQRLMGGLYNCIDLHKGLIQDVDLYLMDSTITLHALNEMEFIPVPQDLLEQTRGQSFPLINDAFTDPKTGQKFGLPMATIPILLIYNPEMIGDLPETVTMELIVKLSADYPIWIPPHGGIGMALTHSVVGNEFSFLSFFDEGLYKLVEEYESLYFEMQEVNGSRAAETDEIVDGFINGEVAWTFHSSGFLTLLAQNGYQGPVATALFPRINQQGGSSISWAWVVPATSKYPDRAWKLADILMNDTRMQRWFLYNGNLPSSAAGFDRLREDPSLMDGLMPIEISNKPDTALRQLETIATESPSWQVPLEIPIDFYNQNFYPLGDKLVVMMANNEITPSNAILELYSLLKEVQ